MMFTDHTLRMNLPGRSRKGLILVGLAVIVVASCGLTPTETPSATATLVPTPRPNDLSPLFAAPTLEEIAAVQADWESRDTNVKEWRIEDELQLEGFKVWIVSHRVDQFKHYGAIRFPKGFENGGSFPVLVINHGGQDGFNLDLGLHVFDTRFDEDQCLSDNFVYVIPSYRGEHLKVSDSGNYLSEGAINVLDRDVDDAIALLDGVLANIPEADPDRVIVWGESRGGGVSLLMGVRDPRVEAVDVFYGLTDYYLPSYHAVVQTMIDYNATNLNHPVLPIALAYLNGHMELESARRFLLRRSVIYFAEQLPQLQIHHGTEDTIVPIEHSDRLMERLEALQQAGIEQEYYRYPGGIHKVESLPESAERTAQFLCSFAKP